MDRKPTGSSEARLDGPSERRHRVFLAGAVVLWSLGALSTRWFGVWTGIGVPAIVLGLWGIGLDARLTADLRRPTPRLLGIGALAGVFMLLVTYGGYAAVMSRAPGLHGGTGELYRFFAALPRYLVPIAVPAIIVSEEIVWRGRVQALFQERMHPLLAAAAAAAIYALAHAPIGSPLLVGVAFACGLFWSLLRAATGSLLPALIAHAIWDLCVMVLFPLTPPA